MITLPAVDYNFFIKKVQTDKAAYKTKTDGKAISLEATVCDTIKFPSLTFVFEDKDSTQMIKYEIPKESYLKQVSADCQILVMKGDADIILGEPFFVNYYTIFDGEKKGVGFVLSNTNQIPAV
jgi:Eukaryotic aspartyl protease